MGKMIGVNELIELKKEKIIPEIVDLYVGDDSDKHFAKEWHKYSDTRDYPSLVIEDNDNLNAIDLLEKNIDKINPKNCRAWGENFTLDKIAPMYEEYFQNILNVYTGKGWYEENIDRNGLSFCERVYPSYPSL
jgi:hypothetical protein